MTREVVTERVERRLAAILAADVAGYSRLMGADEEGTLARLKAHRRELVDPKITQHHGRIVKTTGDGMLIEFASPVEAVRCAVEIQRGMVSRNTDVPDNRRITFRTGINLGDVIAEKGDLFGDGVNVAARLETLWEAGGVAVMRADKIGADTPLARIIAMVAEAQRSRAPIQRMADTVSGYFVPAVIAVAVLAFIGWAFWGPAPALAYALIAAVSVLINACPCALGLATPMSMMVGVGKGAMGGVLIRSAEALERMEKVDTLVVDKTGTLTEGKPRVVAVIPAEQRSEAEVLSLAASLERSSEHPLAAAIVAAAHARALPLADPTEFASVTGKGVTGKVAGHAVALGNTRFMDELGGFLW